MTRGASPVRQSARSSSVGAPAEQALRRLAEEPRAGAVDELAARASSSKAKTATSISAITLRSSVVASSASRRWCAQRLDQRVDLDHHLAERVAAARAARANREVAFAERGEQVRQRLQRQHDALAQREGEAEADRDDQDGQRPLDLGREVAGPQEDQRDDRAGRRRGERHQQDAAVVAEARLARQVRWHVGRQMYVVGASAPLKSTLKRRARVGAVGSTGGRRSQAVALQAAVERAAAQAERLGRLADVAVEALSAFLMRKHSTSSRLMSSSRPPPSRGRRAGRGRPA